MLQFNAEKFDFWDIYNSMTKHYPIGIQKNEGKLYFEYPGCKDLSNAIVSNIHDESNYVSKWVTFTQELEAEINLQIIGTTYGQAPSFSAYVLLESSSLDNLTRFKEIHFFVSLIGSFYTVIGQDTNTVKIDNRHYSGTNYLVISPENEFAEVFKLLCEKIEARFKGFRFIPYNIYETTIEGLDVAYSKYDRNRIFYALFNNHSHVDLNVTSIIGDYNYKSEDWIKDGYIDDGTSWTAYPPIGS